MRRWKIAAAAAAIAACVALGYFIHAAATSPGAPGTNADAKPIAALASSADSCRYARDNECDEPDIGTGACAIRTDAADCLALREGENDSCQWARDGECDEPNFGTGACTQGTDRTDCGEIAWMRNQTDSCISSFNGICEEPGRGQGCAARTDRSDCHGRERPLSINDHFFGRDDRMRVNAQDAPWRFIGEFTNGADEQCTATLIARDVIVTAAHCIHTDAGVRAGGVFEPAAGGASARTIAYLIDPNFNYKAFTTSNESDGLDWALLRIDRPLGDRLGFAGIRNLTGEGRTAARAADLYQAGYSWDTGATLSANIRCHIVETYRDNTFSHECDTTRGDSGSAFLVRSGSGYDVIGVDSNFRSNPDGPFIYIAVSAAAFESQVADFAAGRSGLAVSRPSPPK